MKYSLGFLLIFFTTSCLAGLYKWTDSYGVIYYSDKAPVSETEQLQIPNHLKALADKPTDKPGDSASQYSQFFISKPEADETIRNNENTVDILVTLEPPLIEKHFLQIYLDGLTVGDKTKNPALTLHKMKKGVHRLQAKIVNETGEPIEKTAEVSFEYRNIVDLSKIAPNLGIETQK